MQEITKVAPHPLLIDGGKSINESSHLMMLHVKLTVSGYSEMNNLNGIKTIDWIQ